MSSPDSSADDGLYWSDGFPARRVGAWKRDRIDAHRQSGHAYVIFEYHFYIEYDKLGYHIESSGYHDSVPERKATDSNVEVYDIREQRYTERLEACTGGGGGDE